MKRRPNGKANQEAERNRAQQEAPAERRPRRKRPGQRPENSGHYASKFRPKNTLHKKLAGFDFSSGIYYVNVGEGPYCSWDDCRRFGFLRAGQGRQWSDQIRQLNQGDIVVAYLKGHGYVGVVRVTAMAVQVRDFRYGGKS